METTIRFACLEDEEQLKALLVGYGMDLAGEINEHVVARQGDQIIAGGMLSQIDDDVYHLEVLAVSEQWQRTGAGRLLLSKMIEAPWLYCHESSPRENYSITTVARGDALPFYITCGFKPCSFLELTEPYAEQCDECPDRESCQPVPMILRRGDKI